MTQDTNESGGATLEQLAEQIRSEHEAAEQALRKSVKHAIRVGELLIEVKDRLPRGDFTPWVKRNCPFDERSGRYYRQLTRRFREDPAYRKRVSGSSYREALRLLTEIDRDGESEELPAGCAGLAAHLKRIACDGKFEEVVLSGRFEAVAMNRPHNTLMVAAPALEGAEPLPHEVGVRDLPLLINCLADAGDEAQLRVEDSHVVIDRGGRALVHLTTSDPGKVATRMEAGQARELLDSAKGPGDRIPLPPEVISLVRQLSRRLTHGYAIRLHVGPDSAWLTLGFGQTADILLRGRIGGDIEYSLIFSKDVLVSVLSVVSEPEAALFVAGPQKAIRVEDGQYRYLMAPIDQQQDEPEVEPEVEAAVTKSVDSAEAATLGSSS